MNKIFRLFAFCGVFFALLSFCSMSAFAHEVSTETGYVEYQTEASINFSEVIEIVLTDKETGHYYTHKLYRINNYSGNFSVPFGIYSVEGKVSVASEDSFVTYEITGLPTEITIMSSSVAVPIVLRIDEFIATEVSDPEWTFDGTEYEEYISENVETEPPGAEMFLDPVETEEAVIDTEPESEDNKNTTAGGSMLFGIFCSAAVFCVVAAVLWVLKNKNTEE